MRRCLATTVVLCLISLKSNAAGVPKIQPLAEGKYISVKDGHLSYDGKRIRLWGTNFCNYVTRKGDELVLMYDRMADVGINGIRWNLMDTTFVDRGADNIHTIPKTVKGSGSRMDMFDKAMYLARERGMFFWMTLNVTRAMKAGDYDVLPDTGDRAKWVKMAGEVPFRYLVYIDDRSAAVHMQYVKNMLNHYNPYLGKRYADEEAIGLYELWNENGFIAHALAKPFPGYASKIMQRKWNKWLKAKYKTHARLRKAWKRLGRGESLYAGNIKFAPLRNGTLVEGAGVQREYVATGKRSKKYVYQRGDDVVRFVCWLYEEHTKKSIKFMRAQGKPGVGISVVPITPTGQFGTNLQAYYGAACGDFVANGLYGFAIRPWEVKKTDPNYPFVVRSNAHPLMEQPVDLVRTKGKPHLIYECNDYRPNPFTVEFSTRMAMHSIWQDYDGVFWFGWDCESYLPGLKTDEDYIKRRMPTPDKSYPNAATVLANDEAALAGIKAAGAIFKAGAVPPAPRPLEVTIGKDILFDLMGRPIGGLENRMGLERLLRPYVWKKGMNVTWDPNGPSKLPAPLKVGGRVLAGPHMRYDWHGGIGYMRIDHPAAKVFTGFLRPHLKFKDGVEIRHINRMWGTISLIAEDGLPLEKSKSILVTAMSRNRNKGQLITPERLNTKNVFQQGLAQMCVIRGEAPPVVERIGAEIHAKWLKGMIFEKHDFLRKVFERKPVSGEKLTIRGDEPMFYGRLIRPGPPKRIIVKKLLVMGNSITSHPPNAGLGWKGNWGMAATAREKDWAHLLEKKIEAAQGGKDVQLIVANLMATTLERQTAKAFKALAAHKADVVIIQTGDNISKDKASEKTIAEPLQRLIAELKKANPKALVFISSMWGACPVRNKFLRNASIRSKSGYIYISNLIGNVKNRALSEGHFKHGGVNWHPGDRGMKAIANAMFRSILSTGRIGVAK